jgi:predicted amidophosphoribosyltransferase
MSLPVSSRRRHQVTVPRREWALSRRARRKARREHDRDAAAAGSQRGPRLPSHLQVGFGNVSLQLAVAELEAGRWRRAFEFAESALTTDPEGARDVMAEASAREAKRSALKGDFPSAERYAKRALDLRPGWPAYQERRRLIGEAKATVLRNIREPLFPDTYGPTAGRWWEYDLLGRVRGWDGSRETVVVPMIMEEITRRAVEDVYAVGVYQPWHVSGPTPLFTRYVKELKKHGKTMRLAAVLLRQGLTEETHWAEEVDVLVPMATSLRSYEARGFELTEELTAELGRLLCAPVVDALERAPEAGATHTQGGYRERAAALAATIAVVKGRSALLRDAGAALIVDDVVTYGATFEACALKLREAYPQLLVYGAALAYTETPERRARAQRERGTLAK